MVDPRVNLQTCDGRNTRTWFLQAQSVLYLLSLADERYGQPVFAIAFLCTFLVGPAAQWLQSVRNQNPIGLPWQSVQEFGRDFTRRFEPVDASIVARQQLAVLKQTGSVVSYNNRFMQLLLSIDDIDANTEGLWRYLQGLKATVAGHVYMYRPQNLEAAMQYAQTADAFLWQARTNHHGNHSNNNGPAPMELGSAETSTRTCHICKGAGHMWKRCPNAKEHPCKKCGKTGHPTMYCRAQGKAPAAH